jgi:thiol:disulfide interchange protein DsbD
MNAVGKIIFALVLLIGMGLQSVQAQAVDGGHARVELISEREAAVPGETIWMGLSFEMDDKWHIYWRNAGDAGIPPEIVWSGTTSIPTDTFSAFEWPMPELLPVVPNEIMDYGYSDTIVLPFKVTIPQDADEAILFEGRADYLICKDICIPESAAIKLFMSVADVQVADIRGSTLINEALAQVPVKHSGDAAVTLQNGAFVLSVAGGELAGARGEARFFPHDHEIVHAARQPAEFGPNGLQLKLTPASSADAALPLAGVVQVGDIAFEIAAQPGAILPDTGGSGVNLAQLVVLAMIGGIVLNLLPCVLPILSIKAVGVVSAAASGRANEARAHGIWYTIGILTSFVALASVIVALRAANGGTITWGFWMQNPIFVAVLVLIVFVVGLWLLGLFELGGSVQNIGSGLAQKQGYLGAFFTGVLAVIVGAPCTGPFLAVALGATLTQPAPVIYGVLLAMGIGLALPFLLLSFMPRLQALMPKPGAWMETLKQAFAFPMFLAAAFFLWTLGDVSSTLTAAITVSGGALIAFGIWSLKSQNAGGRIILFCVLGLAMIVPLFSLLSATSVNEVAMGAVWLGVAVAALVLVAKVPSVWAKRMLVAFAGLCIAGGAIWPVVQARSTLPSVMAQTAKTAYPTEAWSRETVDAMLARGRPVFVDFTATWCVNCQVNKRKVLTTAAVEKAFSAANVAFLIADYTKQDPIISAELQRFERAGVPMYLWYVPGVDEPQVLPELLSIDLMTGLAEAAAKSN